MGTDYKLQQDTLAQAKLKYLLSFRDCWPILLVIKSLVASNFVQLLRWPGDQNVFAKPRCSSRIEALDRSAAVTEKVCAGPASKESF